MAVIEIDSLTHPGAKVFAALTESQLRNRLDPERGIIIAESPKVITSALNAGLEPLALLCEKRHITGDAEGIISRCPDMPVYTGEREVLQGITGYTLTRGVLCAMRRPVQPNVEDVCAGARKVCVIHSVTDTTNIGAIFRSAAALGVDAILATPGTCDPLNRRSIRVSMGTVFNVPWTWVDEDLAPLHRMGFTIAALALRHDSITLDELHLGNVAPIALVMGTEGDGLPQQAIADADLVVRIPMLHGVDSLNVAAAAAVAFWQLRQ